MKRTERYLQRATLGLWGQRRADVRAELRGAVEDKLYRYGLLGMSPEAAETAALRDLGSPHRLAWSLGLVHTGTTTLRVSLLLGMAGLLSLQAGAQMPTLPAIPNPQLAPACSFEELYVRLVPGATPDTVRRLQATPTGQQQLQASVLARLSPREVDLVRQALAQPGGLDALMTRCRQEAPVNMSRLLPLDAFYQTLRAAGVTVTPIPGAPMVTLTFPGSPAAQTVNLESTLQQVGETTYVEGAGLIQALKSTGMPLTLSGAINPVLTLGPVRVQLGTPDAPVQTPQLYSDLVASWLSDHWPSSSTHTLPFWWIPNQVTPKDLRVPLNAPEGTLYVTVSNLDFLQHAEGFPTAAYGVAVNVVEQGRLPIPGLGQNFSAPVRAVGSLAELLAATHRYQLAVLIFRLNAADLRSLDLVPVPPTQLQGFQR